jgi:outer membrane protein assembly factor BamB
MGRVHLAGLVAVMVAANAVPAAAQVPALPPLPPIGGTPAPPGERPPPSNPPSNPGPVGTAPGSISEGVDVAHSGFFADDELVPPLVRRWTVKLQVVEGLLAAGGRVFASHPDGVVALDQATGRELWKTGGQSYQRVSAFDDGVVFAITGVSVAAYDAGDGHELWHWTSPRGVTPAGSVASGGVVYVSEGSTLYALSVRDGHMLWQAESHDGAQTPALDAGRVYVGAACANARAFDRTDGRSIWSYGSKCYESERVTPALQGGRLYVPTVERTSSGALDPPVFDAGNGSVVGRFKTSRPVFVDGLSVAQPPAKGPVATDIASGREVWRQATELSGLTAVGHDLYGVSTSASRRRELHALDSETGRVLWSETVPNGTDVTTGGQIAVAAAPGTLLVAAAGRLTAYTSALQPAPRSVAFGGFPVEVNSGGRIGLVGVLGRDLRGSRPDVQIEVAAWPRGRFVRAFKIRASRDGGFDDTFVLYRNGRFRASVGGTRSKVIVRYAWPTLKLGRPRYVTRTVSRIGAVVTTKNVRLGGRTVVLYLDRRRTKGLVRMGSGRLRGGTRARTVITYREPRASRKDTLWYCIRGQLRLALGRPSSLTRRCGAPRLPER